MTTLIALLLITWALTVAGIAAWYRRDRNYLVRTTSNLHATASTLAADLLEARTDADIAQSDARIYLDRIGQIAADKANAVIRADNLASALAFEQGQRVAAEAELDRLRERQVPLLTLDGIRKDREDGITYPGEDEVVVPMKKRAVRR